MPLVCLRLVNVSVFEVVNVSVFDVGSCSYVNLPMRLVLFLVEVLF